MRAAAGPYKDSHQKIKTINTNMEMSECKQLSDICLTASSFCRHQMKASV